MTVRTFGRKGSQDAAMTQRVAAFAAAERARRISGAGGPAPAEAPPEPSAGIVPPGRGATPPSGGAPSPGAGPVREKSLALAYVFWFGCSTVGAHRFYLGFPLSAMLQACLWLGGWLMVLAGFFPVLLAVIAAAIWMLADMFLIPGLARQANARLRGPAYVFE
jgi:TM2 domain-containing membrane protein YozV